MRVSTARIRQLARLVGGEDAIRLRKSAERADKLERRWTGKLHQEFRVIQRDIIRQLLDKGDIKESDLLESLEDFFMEHSLSVMKESLTKAEELPRVSASDTKRMAKPPEAPIPRKFKDLMRMWDRWRKKREIPRRQRAMAKRVKDAYLKRVQSAWKVYGKAFREGKLGEDEVTRHIMKAAKAPFARAKMITETETTYYYNKARVEYYDQSPDVTHYLFVAIRDAATTKWCRTRQGLVYKKGSRYLLQDHPPCHWNCRSEVLPLTPMNPRHLKLINDKSRWRENHRPEPLPPGWGHRAA